MGNSPTVQGGWVDLIINLITNPFLWMVVAAIVLWKVAFFFLDRKKKNRIISNKGEIIHRSLKISLLITSSLFVSSFFFFQLKDWPLFVSTLLFALVTLRLTVFRVKEAFIAVPRSFFVGRISGKDENGFPLPIGKPYGEGLRLKPFWWGLNLLKLKVETLPIDKQDYQVGSGGTILFSGLVQYWPSDVSGYREAEIGEVEVREGLSSDLDQVIIKKLASLEVDKPDLHASGVVDTRSGIDLALQSKAEISRELEALFQGREIDDKGTTRSLFGSDVSYAEHNYGVRVTMARINRIDPEERIKESRDKIQVERYETRSERIQLTHFMNRVNDVRRNLKIETSEAVEIVMLNMKLTTKDIRQWQIDGVSEGFSELMALVKGKLKKRG